MQQKNTTRQQSSIFGVQTPAPRADRLRDVTNFWVSISKRGKRENEGTRLALYAQFPAVRHVPIQYCNYYSLVSRFSPLCDSSVTPICSQNWLWLEMAFLKIRLWFFETRLKKILPSKALLYNICSIDGNKNAYFMQLWHTQKRWICINFNRTNI